jgi:hypothetical protein
MMVFLSKVLGGTWGALDQIVGTRQLEQFLEDQNQSVMEQTEALDIQ